MSWAAFEAFAQLAVGRVLNSLPESLLIVLSAALLVKLAGRRSSGTRFAVWMVAFCAVAALPFFSLGSLHSEALAAHSLIVTPHFHPELTVSSLWAVALLVLWIPFALLALARVVTGVLRVRSIRNHCREIAPAALPPMLRTTLAEHAGRRAVRLVTCDAVRVPMAIGFRRPAVVLPAWALEELPAAQLRPILIHELAHLARRDDWTNLLQKFVRAVFCFHPAVWWVDAKLSRERELACDDAVLVATADPHTYATSLIGLLEKSGLRRGWTMAQAAIGRACEATQRITRILTGGRPANPRVSRSVLAVAAATSAACAGLLLAAPRLIVFGPQPPNAPIVATQAAASAELPEGPRLFRSSAPAGAPAIAAAWHPQPLAATSLVFPTAEIFRTPEAPQPRSARRSPDAAQSRRPATRPELQPAAVQTAAVQTAAARPSSLSKSPAATLLAFHPSARPFPELPAARTPRVVPAGRPSQPAFVETIQLVEQDAAGLHVQIFHLIVVGPAQNPAAQAAARSQSI